MPCFRPLKGHYARVTNPSGKRSISFTHKEADLEAPITLPCGQCRFCRLEHSRNWAVRCTNEASLFDRNSFITLTYADEYLPKYGSITKEAPVSFMKDLRREFGEGIRSFGCAEYGEKLSRPHYHLCLFNVDFPDKMLWKKDEENSLYISKTLQELWPYGHSTIGDLTFESAAYVARYVTKKITGKRAPGHYQEIDPQYGEIREKLPEQSVALSRMPGIGRNWYEQNKQFLIDHDFLISRGRKVPIPKYYARLLEKEFPEKFKENKRKRREKGNIISEKLLDEDHKAMEAYKAKHNAWEHGCVPPKPRLYVMEEVQELKFELLKRGLEK